MMDDMVGIVGAATWGVSSSPSAMILVVNYIVSYASDS